MSTWKAVLLPDPRLARRRALLLAVSAMALALAAVALTEWLHLKPCHLCIFQRLLYMLIAALMAGAWLFWRRGRTASSLLASAIVLAAAGAAVAGHQSWLQRHPEASIGCGAGDPGLIEQLVEWLGMCWPTVFMATGFCENKELEILGLSLANWSFLAFAAATAAATTLFFSRRSNTGGNRQSTTEESS